MDIVSCPAAYLSNKRIQFFVKINKEIVLRMFFILKRYPQIMVQTVCFCHRTYKKVPLVVVHEVKNCLFSYFESRFNIPSECIRRFMGFFCIDIHPVTYAFKIFVGALRVGCFLKVKGDKPCGENSVQFPRGIG